MQVMKLEKLEFKTVMQIVSFVKMARNLSYLYDVDDVKFYWTKLGQIKNIEVREYTENGRILAKVNMPLSAKGELNGAVDVYTGSTGNFKIEWSNGIFKRVLGGGKKLKASLCPDYGCSNLIQKFVNIWFLVYCNKN